ncbi:hypothetical protein, partial [Akkermansia sp.]|uniref:hypothetical protein n=1 Tax=Akkermansia sp. TaxID=1872421 RepID=UPI003AB3E03C
MPLSVDFPIIISFLSRQPEHRLKMNSNNQSKGEWHPLFFHHAVSCTGCARDIACVLNHTKKSQVLRHFPVARYTGGFLRFFHTFPCLHSVRPNPLLNYFTTPFLVNVIENPDIILKSAAKCGMPPALSPRTD